MATKTPSSTDLKALVKRVKAGKTTVADKAVLTEILGHSIRLTQLVEKSKGAAGGKKILASLPFGFDIVK